MLALGKPRSVGEIILVSTKMPHAPLRPIERNEPGPWGGFVLSADQSDENDHPPNVRPVRRGGRFKRGGW
jgi:hypothetical protein